MNEENGCAPANISGSEASDFIMIKDGVAYDPNEVANTKSSFIRDLCFSLSKQELNFWISNAGICNANFRLFTSPTGNF